MQEQGAFCHDLELVVWYRSTLDISWKHAGDLLPEKINNLLRNTADLVCLERAGTAQITRLTSKEY